MQIQSNLGSTIAMAFDECPSSVAERRYVEDSVARTTRWLERCKKEMQRLNSLEDTINKEQLLFGINQGAIFRISGRTMQREFRNWIWMGMQLADLQWEKPMNRCIRS